MKNIKIALFSFLLLICAGCATELQEAVLSGAYDFVTNSVSDTLEAILPLADLVAS